VRWEATVRLLLERGVRRFIELGPGKVLRGLVRAVDSSVELLGVEDVETLEGLKKTLVSAGAGGV
jgi:[acyl-carrier-protein] S-malonyltransferase